MPYPFRCASLSSRSAGLSLFWSAGPAEARVVLELREKAHMPTEASDQRRMESLPSCLLTGKGEQYLAVKDGISLTLSTWVQDQALLLISSWFWVPVSLPDLHLLGLCGSTGRLLLSECSTHPQQTSHSYWWTDRWNRAKACCVGMHNPFPLPLSTPGPICPPQPLPFAEYWAS